MKLQEVFSSLKEVQEKIGSSPPLICGGVARDKFMNRLENVSDVDITTGDKTVSYLAQEFAISLNKKYNISKREMPDGHITIFLGNLKLDFSSNFRVPNIEIILKDLKVPSTDLNQEMFSRDFTCNSLLLSLDLRKIMDPTHRGFEDIKNKIIKTCLSPEITLTSNKNRVIRSIYLATKLNFDIDPKIIEFVKKHPESAKIATERVSIEKLNQAFEKDPDKASYFLTQMNLWDQIPIPKAVYPYYMKHLRR